MAKKRSTTTTKKKNPTKKSENKRQGASAKEIDPETRYKLIAEEAYFNAMKRDNVDGDQLSDWLHAEKTIDSQFITK